MSDIIIPATGTGERFIKAGYSDFKPFVKVNDHECVLDYVVNCFDKKDDYFYFIAQSHRVEEFNNFIKTRNIKGEVVVYDGKKLGPVGAVYYSKLPCTKDVTIAYCDFGMLWNYKDFRKFVDNTIYDGVVPCYTGYHPHLLPENNVYAACKVNSNKEIIEVIEKYRSNDKLREYWSPGIHWFKSLDVFMEAARKMIEHNDLLNGEYYVSKVYNYVSSSVVYDKVDKFFQFGTPSDFEYAKDKLSGIKSKNEVDVDNLVILSAGKGERFAKLNYKFPKPFLPLKDSTIINCISNTFPNKKDYLCIGSDAHEIFWSNSNLKYKLIPSNKIGASYSYKMGCEQLKGSTFIVPCDLIAKYNFNKDEDCDAIVYVSKAVDFNYKNCNSFAWVTGDSNKISKISVKERVDDTDKVLIGSFYVKDNQLLIKYINKLFDNKLTTNGEYYLDNAFREMVNDGLNVKYSYVDHYYSFGTPEEYTENKYWYEVEA